MSARFCTCNVLYTKHGNMTRLHAITAITNDGNFIELYKNNSKDDCLYFDDIQEAYKHVLSTLKFNGFKTKYYYSLNMVWCNILWCDCDNLKISKKGYRGWYE